MKRTEKKPASQIGPQGKAFIKAAHEIGCDEDEAAFEAKLKKIAKAPSPKDEGRPKRVTPKRT